MSSLSALLAKAQKLSQEMDCEADVYLEELQLYLQEFEEWRTAAEHDACVMNDREQRAIVEQLAAAHFVVMQRAEERQAELSEKISDIHRRAHALRIYMDQLPSRITIAGKREG